MKRKKSGCVSRERRRRTKKGNPGERKEEGRKERVRRRGPLGPSDPRRNSSCNSRSRIAPRPSGGARPVESLRERLLSFVSGHLVLARRPSGEFGRVARVPSPPPSRASCPDEEAPCACARARARVKYPLGEKIDRGD